MVNTRSRKISNEKDDKSNSEDESLSGRDEQVEIIDEQRQASKKTSNRNSYLKKVRTAKTSQDDTLPQTIIKHSKEENSEENDHKKQFVSDHRTVDVDNPRLFINKTCVFIFY